MLANTTIPTDRRRSSPADILVLEVLTDGRCVSAKQIPASAGCQPAGRFPGRCLRVPSVATPIKTSWTSGGLEEHLDLDFRGNGDRSRLFSCGLVWTFGSADGRTGGGKKEDKRPSLFQFSAATQKCLCSDERTCLSSSATCGLVGGNVLPHFLSAQPRILVFVRPWPA